KDGIFLSSVHFAVLFCDIFELVWREARTIGARTQGFNLLAIELLSFHLLFRKSVHAFFEMILPALRNLLDVCKSSSLRLPPTSRLFSIRHGDCDSTEDAIALKEAKRKARNVRNNENRTLQLLTDPDYYKRYYERQSGHFHKWYQKPEVRERIRVKHKLDRQRKLAEDPHYNLKKMIFR
ncbi:hypothetical protein D6C91_04431, partial [Aureobasidium pullulans]